MTDEELYERVVELVASWPAPTPDKLARLRQLWNPPGKRKAPAMAAGAFSTSRDRR